MYTNVGSKILGYVDILKAYMGPLWMRQVEKSSTVTRKSGAHMDVDECVDVGLSYEFIGYMDS